MRSLDIKKVSMNTTMHVASKSMLSEKTYLKAEALNKICINKVCFNSKQIKKIVTSSK